MFRDIIGQDNAKTALKQAVGSGRLPGTFLFTGTKHVGKTMTAKALAQTLNCEAPREDFDGCGECYSCRAIESQTHPDVRHAAPSGLSHMLRIPQFWPRDSMKDYPADRAMLRDIEFGPVRAKKRVFIIEDSDAMNGDTANSLLKVLEEPPPYAIFILTASSDGAVLPTIASRSLSLRFTRIPAELIENELKKSGVDAHQARFLAAMSEGKIGSAIDLAGDAKLISARSAIIDIAATLSAGIPVIQSFRVSEELKKCAEKLIGAKKGDVGEGQRTALVRALDIVLIWFADLMRVAASGSDAQIVNIDRAEILASQAAAYTPAILAKASRILLDTRRHIERNANAQIALESCLLRVARLLGSVTLDRYRVS